MELFVPRCFTIVILWCICWVSLLSSLFIVLMQNFLANVDKNGNAESSSIISTPDQQTRHIAAATTSITVQQDDTQQSSVLCQLVLLVICFYDLPLFLDGIIVWLNVSTWMWDQSRSRSRSWLCLHLHTYVRRADNLILDSIECDVLAIPKMMHIRSDNEFKWSGKRMIWLWDEWCDRQTDKS